MDVLKNAVCFIPDRLYFVSLRSKPVRMETKTHYFFNIDDIFLYQNFYSDFGPLNIGLLYRYCHLLKSLLNKNQYKGKRIVHCTCSSAMKRSNAACLIACYAILDLNHSPEEAYRPLSRMSPPLMPFRDASYGSCTFKLSVLHVLRGFAQGCLHNFFDFDTFDVNKYEFYEQVPNGDLNWIVPGRFLAFAGPHTTKHVTMRGYTHLEPEDYFEYFAKHNVKHVIRLNTKQYESARFAKVGITVHPLTYPDGSTPSPAILKKFLDICESAEGAIAVHCKAGLGRTGTLIGCYLMKHFMITAHEAIGWMRLCRPGSVIGPQQFYLQDCEKAMWKEGARAGGQRKTIGDVGDWTNTVHSALANNTNNAISINHHQRNAIREGSLDVDINDLRINPITSTPDSREAIIATSPPGVKQGDGLKSQKELRFRRGLSLGALHRENQLERTPLSSTGSVESQINVSSFTSHPAPNKSSRIPKLVSKAKAKPACVVATKTESIVSTSTTHLETDSDANDNIGTNT